MADALIIAFMQMLFKSDDNNISEEGVKILLQNKWIKIKDFGFGSYSTM